MRTAPETFIDGLLQDTCSLDYPHCHYRGWPQISTLTQQPPYNMFTVVFMNCGQNVNLIESRISTGAGLNPSIFIFLRRSKVPYANHFGSIKIYVCNGGGGGGGSVGWDVSKFMWE